MCKINSIRHPSQIFHPWHSTGYSLKFQERYRPIFLHPKRYNFRKLFLQSQKNQPGGAKLFYRFLVRMLPTYRKASQSQPCAPADKCRYIHPCVVQVPSPPALEIRFGPCVRCLEMVGYSRLAFIPGIWMVVAGIDMSDEMREE